MALLVLLVTRCDGRVAEPSTRTSNAASALEGPGWSATTTQATARRSHSMVPLLDGRVLLAGGRVDSGPALTLVEVYDPYLDTFQTVSPLPRARQQAAAVLLHNGNVVLMGGVDSSGSATVTTEIYDPALNLWMAGPDMGQARAGMVAVRLMDGRVLAAGGFSAGTHNPRAEILDAAATGFSPAGTMAAGRSSACAALLPNGDVLIAGGRGEPAFPLALDLYGPANNTWTSPGALAVARNRCSATLMADERVLIAGGSFSDIEPGNQSADIFTPSTGTLVLAALMGAPRAEVGAVLLPDGTVMVTTESTASSPFAEMYDPDANTWTADAAGGNPLGSHVALTPAGRVLTLAAAFGSQPVSMRRAVFAPRWTGPVPVVPSELHAAVLLLDGRVMLVGGPVVTLVDVDAAAQVEGPGLSTLRRRHTATVMADGRILVVGGEDSAVLASAEVSSATQDAWTEAASLAQARTEHTATLMLDGTVLVVGGSGGLGPLSSTEGFNPVTGEWTDGQPLAFGRAGHSATRLRDGDVLIVGGSFSSSAVRGTGTQGPWLDAGTLPPRSHHTATMLADGRVLVVGGELGGVFLGSAVLSDVGVTQWTDVGPLPVARAYHSASLLPDGRVLVAGGENSNGPLPDALLFDVTTGRWAAAPPPAAMRTRHRATTLVDGRIFLTGRGAPAEVFDVVGPTARVRPLLTGPAVMTTGKTNVMAGMHLAGVHSGSGGGVTNAAVNHPVASLEMLEGMRVAVVATAFTDDSVTVKVPSTAPRGLGILRVTVGGVSGGRVVRVKSNVPPVVQAPQVAALSGAPTDIHVMVSDDDGDALVWSIQGGPLHGTVTGALPDITYTSSAGYTGPDSIFVRVGDGAAVVDATIQIEVSIPDPVITAPLGGGVVTASPVRVAGTAFRNTAVSIREGTAVLGFSAANSLGVFFVDITAADGVHTVTAVQDLGGVEKSSAAVTFTADLGAPQFSNVPTNGIVEAVTPQGSPVSYGLPTATDSVDGVVAVTCEPPPGSVFPLGNTSVVCTASDGNAHTSRTVFTIGVQDTTPPTLMCPQDQSTVAADPFGAVVPYLLPAATDLVSTEVMVRASHLPEDRFVVGTTVVTLTATDTSGNQAMCTFSVTVAPPPARDAGVVVAGDGGPPAADAGQPGLVDAGVAHSVDASATAPGEDPSTPGCGCVVSGAEHGSTAWLGVVLLLVLRKMRYLQ